jgi:hypothetical protein
MSKDQVRATLSVAAAAAAVFAVLTDPTTHAAIDGTGRVRGALDPAPLSRVGQIFRMAMYHPDHPDGSYETANKVQVLDAPQSVGWLTGYDEGDGRLVFDGWTWRYDLVPLGQLQTNLTLTYDWSAVSDEIREYLHFPPFGPDHLLNSLQHVAELTQVDGRGH